MVVVTEERGRSIIGFKAEREGTVESISESIWEDHLRHTDRERAPHVDICILKRHRTMAPELSAISSMQAQNSSFIN